MLAALVLARLPDPDLGAPLARAAKTEPDREVAEKLLHALSRRTEPEAAFAAVERLVAEGVEHPDSAALARSAAAALMRMPELPEGALLRLVDAAASENPAIRAHVAPVLGRHGTATTAGDALRGLLFDDVPAVRLSAGWAWLELEGATVDPLVDVHLREGDAARQKQFLDLARMFLHR